MDWHKQIGLNSGISFSLLHTKHQLPDKNSIIYLYKSEGISHNNSISFESLCSYQIIIYFCFKYNMNGYWPLSNVFKSFLSHSIRWFRSTRLESTMETMNEFVLPRIEVSLLHWHLFVVVFATCITQRRDQLEYKLICNPTRFRYTRYYTCDHLFCRRQLCIFFLICSLRYCNLDDCIVRLLAGTCVERVLQ